MAERWTIGVDWGTSRFRAFLITPAGEIAERIENDRGILAVPPGEFGRELTRVAAPWRARHGDALIVASGMVGSRQGWREVPYARCPAAIDDIARHLTGIDAGELGTIWIVPGLVYRGADGSPDVMRGEETQLIGLASRLGDETCVVVLPGTHSKWATMDRGRIASFATYMTGELFAILVERSILGRLMAGREDDFAAFDRGVETTAVRGRAILGSLFSARSLGLLGDLPASSLYSYLSGLLIGAEIAEGLSVGATRNLASVTIVGRSSLALLYVRAFNRCGVAASQLGDEVTAWGLARIARSHAMP
jgi:2-dehydro-3-deoxygalactonokinase